MRKLTDSKRQAILKAAAAVFAQKGFHGTLVDAVAARAGIGKGTVYRYFRNKEDLFFSILDQGAQGQMLGMEQALRSSEDPREKLREILLARAEFVLNNKPLLKLLPEIESRKLQRRAMVIRRRNQRMVKLVERTLQEGIDRGSIKDGDTGLWAKCIVHITRAAYSECLPARKDAVTDQLMDFILRGIAV